MALFSADLFQLGCSFSFKANFSCKKKKVVNIRMVMLGVGGSNAIFFPVVHRVTTKIQVTVRTFVFFFCFFRFL